MALLRFVLWRILRGAVALSVFLFLAYLAVGTFIPNDANTIFPVMTEAEFEAYQARLGLERPLVVQFGIWIRGLITGELGRTTFGAPVATKIGDALIRTVFVFVLAIPMAYVLGSWLGRRSGWKRRPGSDAPTLVAVILGTAFPPFLAFVLTLVLREQTSYLADLRSGLVGSSREVWAATEMDRTGVLWAMVVAVLAAAVAVGVVLGTLPTRRRIPASVRLALTVTVAIAGWVLFTDLERNAVDLLVAAAVPVLAFAILSFGEFMVVAQAAVAVHRSDDFVMAARAKGLSERRIRDRHGGSSARLVMMSRLAISLPYLMTGLIIIEQALDWPGLGDFLFQALQGRDLPTVMSSLLVIGGITLASRVVLDVTQRVLDPRLGGAESWA